MGIELSAAEIRAARMRARGITPATLPDPILGVLHHDPNAGLLEVRYPTPGEKDPEQVVSLAFLLKLPELGMALAEAVARHGKSVPRPDTRERVPNSLRRGFVAFLVDTKRTGIKPEEVSTALLQAFKLWLDERRTAEGEPLAEPTRQMFLMDLQLLLKRLLQRKRWRERLHPELELLVNPYPGASRKHKPTTPLTDEEFEKVYLAAVKEVGVHSAATGKLLDEMALAPGLDTWADTPNPSFAHAVNTLWDIYGTKLPDWNTLADTHPRLARRLKGRFGEAKAALVPTLRTLAPYIVLFALYFRYNKSVLFGSKRQDFSIRTFLGKRRVVARAYKHRSRRRQFAAVPATDDPDNPDAMLRFMDRWMRRAREHAPRHSRRHLLIAAATARGGWVRNIVDINSVKVLGQFCADNELPDFGMRVLRASALDVVHDIFKGDFLALMAASGQRHAQTFLSHYSNGGVRSRQDEALAAAMVLKERWEASGGTIDPRLNRGDDHAAATPGFICLDPFASPMPDQRDKPICSAYGMCPICPLAVVLRSSGYSYAQVLLLEDAIERTIDDIADTAKWGPVRDRLRYFWRDQFSDAAKASARETYSDLPSLPKVD